MGPGFRYYEGFVVVVWWGVRVLGRRKLKFLTASVDCDGILSEGGV